MEVMNPHIKAKLAELKGLRSVVDYLYDGVPEAFTAIYFIKGNFKEWELIFKYLKDNKIRGQSLVDFFKNESDETGGGYLLGVTLILSRIKGHKNLIKTVKIDELN